MRGIFMAAFLLTWTGVANAACYAMPWGLIWDLETEAYMISDGSVCGTRVAWTDGSTTITSVSIASGARNGVAGWHGSYVIYRPNPGFKGQDSFVFAVTGKLHTEQKRATVRVIVKVE